MAKGISPGNQPIVNNSEYDNETYIVNGKFVQPKDLLPPSTDIVDNVFDIVDKYQPELFKFWELLSGKPLPIFNRASMKYGIDTPDDFPELQAVFTRDTEKEDSYVKGVFDMALIVLVNEENHHANIRQADRYLTALDSLFNVVKDAEILYGWPFNDRLVKLDRTAPRATEISVGIGVPSNDYLRSQTGGQASLNVTIKVFPSILR